jgi:hypothetical protein
MTEDPKTHRRRENFLVVGNEDLQARSQTRVSNTLRYELQLIQISCFQIDKDLDMLVLLINQWSEPIFSNTIDADLGGNHLLRLQCSSLQCLNDTLIILILISQHYPYVSKCTSSISGQGSLYSPARYLFSPNTILFG